MKQSSRNDDRAAPALLKKDAGKPPFWGYIGGLYFLGPAPAAPAAPATANPRLRRLRRLRRARLSSLILARSHTTEAQNPDAP